MKLSCMKTLYGKHLWNVGQLLPDHMAQHPRRQSSSYSLPWEPEISPSSAVLCMMGSLIQIKPSVSLGKKDSCWFSSRHICTAI
jgi:hypothetical protein